VVKDLSISIGNKELLSHANLQLQRGRKYILHGRNGIGKSTLLRAIATDQIPNIPRGVKVLLLGQVESEKEDDPASKPAGEDESVLQHVLRSDQKRERLLREARQLSAAFEDASNPLAAVGAYRRVSHERLEDEVAAARQIAIRRSGARGARSRQVLIKLEEALVVSEGRLSSEIAPDDISEESRKAAEMLAEVQLSLELVWDHILQSCVASLILRYRWMPLAPKPKHELSSLVSASQLRVSNSLARTCQEAGRRAAVSPPPCANRSISSSSMSQRTISICPPSSGSSDIFKESTTPRPFW
jgi:ABC-type dipeptide/oligopeptide/nickel transport system ATPase subunit